VSPRRHELLAVKMADGSIVQVSVQLAKPGAEITERDKDAIRACIEAISATRMDPQRADRKARTARRASCIYQDDGEGSGLCLNCGEPRRKHSVYGGGEE
jgi:hypothetical protein